MILPITFRDGFLYQGDSLVVFRACPCKPPRLRCDGIDGSGCLHLLHDVEASRALGTELLERRWAELIRDIHHRRVRL